MPGAKVTFTESALCDLEGIQEWYTEEGVPELGQPFLRELIHPPFRIVYRRDAQRVRVVRIWRSERLLRLPPTATARDSLD